PPRECARFHHVISKPSPRQHVQAPPSSGRLVGAVAALGMLLSSVLGTACGGNVVTLGQASADATDDGSSTGGPSALTAGMTDGGVPGPDSGAGLVTEDDEQVLVVDGADQEVDPNCVPETCTPEGGQYCGEIGDGCDGVLNCDAPCAGDWVCSDQGL